MKTIVTITGIRPDFIRMSEIFKKLDNATWCNHILVHTGQHYDNLMSGIFFKDLNLREPDYNLKIGGPGKLHYHQQAELGVKIIELFEINKINPDVVLFLGDSNSVLASVPLRKEGFKIGHIEAGMRSYDERMLEELNRKVCDHMSNFLFVYHENYRQKALREGISDDKIFVVGNTIIEPLTKIMQKTESKISSHILLDIHRPENFRYPDRMRKIIEFANFAKRKTGVPIKMLNFGRTIGSLRENQIDLGSIEVVDLMGYKDFVKFMQDSLFIISDSGTAQEEPALLKIPVIVPREFTERPESVENNNSIMLSLFEEKSFEDALRWALGDIEMKTEWLGNGTTSQKIVQILENVL